MGTCSPSRFRPVPLLTRPALNPSREARNFAAYQMEAQSHPAASFYGSGPRSSSLIPIPTYLPLGILLTGAPGTGKTLLAKAIAGEAGVPFFYRAGSEFEEMFVGVGARRVRSLFQAAKKKAPCIIFIDEIDAVGSTRKQWEGHTKKTLHQLLVEMDGFEQNEGIIVMAATNLADILDPALTRPGRFDRHIVVPSPDVRGRQEILELYLQGKPMSDDVDVKAIARGTPGFNGADLANLVNIAAIKAAVEGAEKLSAEQLEFAKDRIVMGTERKTMFVSEDSKKLTAYHESGHAIVALNTKGAHPIHKATIMPRGSALGMVTQLPSNDETSVSKRQLLARLDVCMGGRVAEELIFGQDHITTGASSDLSQATELAQYMVSSCGMSETIGPVHIKERPSSEMQSRIDAEVVKLLREAYERVKSLLKRESYIVREGDPVDEMLFIMRGKLLTMTTNGGRTGFFNSEHLGAGDFCGEELLTWALDPHTSSNLPISTRTVRALVEVEAFALKADDLKFVASQFRRLHSKQLRHTFRFYSQQWRTWAACFIQAAWRRHVKKKLEESLKEEDNRLQDALAKEACGSSPSLGATMYASRFAANILRTIRRSGSVRKPRMAERMLLQKPAEPDFNSDDYCI
ncbi:hypothetical protein F2Q70_00015133 [Brassica cretica]|uniref:Cyclic nucleotide-binding domain-containing protein n=1 Tax=Brassica cretica TaxID=69181 RepID=A0A8S9HYC0_BRACR|nr:hypothetical protein F2Q70_00015133 [Brassica cretica]